MGGLSWLAQCALDFLIDERCHGCGQALDRALADGSDLAAPVTVFSARIVRLTTRVLCDSCASKIMLWPGPVILPATSSPDALSRVYPVLVTDERVLALIHLLKFARRRRIAPWLAAAMMPRLPDFSVAKRTCIVVPVPMDRGARLRRGFNQAEEIARALARHWNLPLEARALVKIRQTRPQSTLGRDERLVNLEGAFRADAHRLRDADVILVDDLVTTGATVRACAVALRSAGARQVIAVCVGFRDQPAPGAGSFPQS